MKQKIFLIVVIVFFPLVCIAGIWKNYSQNSPAGNIYYHDGYIWGKSEANLWRFDPYIKKYELISPSDWSETGGNIQNLLLSKNKELCFVIEYEGFVKFDGIDWQFYDPKKESIYDIGNIGIAEDSSGRFWFTGGNELIYFENDHWSTVKEIEGIPLSGQYLITNNSKGNLYLLFTIDSSNNKYGLACKIEDKWTIYPFPEGYGFFNTNSEFFADSSGGVWFVCYVGDITRIIKFTNGVFNTITDQKNLSISAITEDTDGTIWLATNSIYKIKGETCEKVDIAPLYQDLEYIASIDGITILPDDSVWAFVRDSSDGPPIGFVVIRGTEISRLDVDFGNFKSVEKISINGDMGAFVGFSSSDYIFKVDDIENPMDFTSLEYTKPSTSSTSRDLLIDSSDRIWWAAEKFFISFSDNIPVYHHKESWYPSKEKSQALAEGPDGSIWVAMENHLFNFKNDTWTEAVMSSYSSCSSLAVDMNGVVWMGGGMSGLSKYDGNDRVNVDLNPCIVNDVSADSLGGVWVAATPFSTDVSQGGLFYILGESITRYNETDGLPSHYIEKVAAVPDGSVWFSFRDYVVEIKDSIKLTTGGICHFDKENIEIYRPKDGLASPIIEDIAVSTEKILWFATNAGLSTLSLDKIPDPMIRIAMNKHILKAGDDFKLGINLKNIGNQQDVRLLVGLLYQGNLFYFDFLTSQFIPNFSALPVTLPKDIKVNAEIWELVIPAGLEGKEIQFATALIEKDNSTIISEIYTEKVSFIP
jgi:streptogramin lyase